MKKTFYIKKSRLYSEVNYSAVLSNGKYNGFNLNYKELDNIFITSGAICFFDAYNPNSLAKPFSDAFPKGKCTPYTMSVSTSNGVKIAFAGLKFTDKKALKWKTALSEEKEVIKLSLSENITTPISSGIACIGDFIAFRDYLQLVKNNENSSFHPLDTIVQFDGHTGEVMNLPEGSNFAVFSSGWGEGVYSCYIGLDENDKITGIICDFGMIEKSAKKSGEDETLEFVFDINPEELYQNDPKLSDAENGIAKWTLVISNSDSIDGISLFNAFSRRGYLYHSIGHYSQALEDYMKAIDLGHELEKTKAFKFHAWTLYDNAGTINKETGNIENAIKLFSQAKDYGDSFYAGAYINLIDIYVTQKKLDEAIKIADEMVRDRPHDANAYNKRAEIYVQKEDYVSAINDYDILIIKFKWSEAILEKSACLSMMGNNDSALLCLEEYIVENKANEFYYYNKALIEYRKNEFSKSYQNVSNAYFVNPDYLPALHLLIELDTVKLNYSAIIKWASKYIELRPMQIFGYNVRAEGFYKLKNYSAAIDDYEYIILHIAQNPEIISALIKSCVLNRDIMRAKKYLKTLKKEDESFFLNACGFIHYAKRRFLYAERMLISAFNQSPCEQFLNDLIDFYLKINRLVKAEDYIIKMSQLFPVSENSILKAIEYYKKIGNYENMQKQIDAYVSKFLNNTDDMILRKNVEEILKR